MVYITKANSKRIIRQIKLSNINFSTSVQSVYKQPIPFFSKWEIDYLIKYKAFLEEPENFMHPQMLDMLTQMISETRHQVFIVTHNIEFLEKLLWYAKDKERDLEVFGFYNLKDGIPEFEKYDLKTAYNAINTLSVDLRLRNS